VFFEHFSDPMGEAYEYVDLQYKTKDSTPLNVEITAGKNTQEFEVGTPIRERVKIMQRVEDRIACSILYPLSSILYPLSSIYFSATVGTTHTLISLSMS